MKTGAWVVRGIGIEGVKVGAATLGTNVEPVLIANGLLAAG